MKALVLALVLLTAQTIDAGAYVVCDATPHRAACLGPRIGTNYRWRGWYGPGWYRWHGPYAGLYGYGWPGPYAGLYDWRGPYAGPPGPYGWRGPYTAPYFQRGPYF
jgi:hypothetical protein